MTPEEKEKDQAVRKLTLLMKLVGDNLSEASDVYEELGKHFNGFEVGTLMGFVLLVEVSLEKAMPDVMKEAWRKNFGLLTDKMEKTVEEALNVNPNGKLHS